MLLLRAWVPCSTAGPMCHALLLCSVDAPTRSVFSAPTRSAGPMCHTLCAIHLFRMTLLVDIFWLLIDSYSCADEVNRAFQGVSYSDYIPYADPCYGWSSRIPHLSPVGKFWDRISSKSISSEKQRSMNPELTCFPIEEDPSTSGENENRGEVAGTNQTSQEDISSKVMICGAKREHLAELTDACVDPATSVSAVERFPNRSSFDSVNTNISFNGTCSMVKEKHGNLSTKKRRCTNGAKGN
ncbi:hypothetical protein U1Q18_049921 [Sarracenia purpurea var. burkii]